MIKRTISVMVGKGSVNHNSRKFHAANTDPERSRLNISYCNEDIRKVYHELFDDALGRYNAKQARADRRIENYYEKIRSGKQEKLFHEVIFQIGNMEDTNARSEYGQLAAKVLDEFMRDFQKRNPNLRVFSAHLHMDEATPHLHIDFLPFITGSKRGLDTRVSLKQALAAQGFRGGSRGDTEWSQWVNSEKEQLAEVMRRHAIDWERLGVKEEHLSVLDYKKERRIAEVAALDAKIVEKEREYRTVSNRIENYEQAEESLEELAKKLDTTPEYQLPELAAMMSAKSYRAKFVEPLVKKLKALVQSVLIRYFKIVDDYYRLNSRNGSLYSENEMLRTENKRLSAENVALREKTKEYSLLRKVFGSKQIDQMLAQAKLMKVRKRDSRSR